ncbi:Phosphoglycolate phosphatase [bacterium HR40]|nr:Phosphoglycolate phosphatase [bacterium HR40]
MTHRLRRWRGILFDKDGTLVDFRACWIAAYRGAASEVAERAGLPAAFADELLRRSGFDPGSGTFSQHSPLLWATNAAIAALWAAQPELSGVAGIEALVLAHFSDDERYPPRPTVPLPPLFETLAARQFLLGVATMDTTARARAQLEQLGIAHRLHFVAGCDAGFGEKPHPGMVHGFCAETGLVPEEVVVVGDTLADLDMARAAGAGLVVAVRTGGTPTEVLQRSADHVLCHVAELPALLAAIEGAAPRC